MSTRLQAIHALTGTADSYWVNPWATRLTTLLSNRSDIATILAAAVPDAVTNYGTSASTDAVARIWAFRSAAGTGGALYSAATNFLTHTNWLSGATTAAPPTNRNTDLIHLITGINYMATDSQGIVAPLHVAEFFGSIMVRKGLTIVGANSTITDRLSTLLLDLLAAIDDVSDAHTDIVAAGELAPTTHTSLNRAAWDTYYGLLDPLTYNAVGSARASKWDAYAVSINAARQAEAAAITSRLSEFAHYGRTQMLLSMSTQSGAQDVLTASASPALITALQNNL